MENNENYEKLSGVLHKFLGDAFNKKMGELNIDKLSEYLSYSVFVHFRVLH
ncbi:hypothetical protein TH0551_09940 [Helicobacter pylori]